jgi:DNA processing protein
MDMSTRRLAPLDPGYPEALVLLGPAAGRAPPDLYLRGELPTSSGIAIVGTRDATADGCAFAAELARILGAEGYGIWSGGAEGIDAAAHAGALDAAAATVAILAGGLDDPFPQKHADLFGRILAAGGALASLQPDGATRRRHQFLERNWVLVAATVATIVVEARLGGGTSSTAGWGRKLGRPLCVVPGAPWAPAGAGCALELERGALAVSSPLGAVRCLRALGLAPSPLSSPPSRAPPGAPRGPSPGDAEAQRAAAERLGEAAAQLLAALDAEPRHPDELCARTGLGTVALQRALAALSLSSLVHEHPPGHYRRMSRHRSCGRRAP